MSTGRIFTILLSAFVLFSAFTVVYVKDVNRRWFISYQGLQKQHQELYVEWGKLLLEQGTWSRQQRIQQIAQKQLNMEVPAPHNVVVFKR